MNRGNEMRLFAAIMITSQCHEALAGTLEVMKQSGISGRFVPAKNLHITLAFIGTQESAEPVIDALRSISFRPFEISLSTTGMFGDTFWAGTEDCEELEALAEQVRQKLSDAGIPYDTKDFVPHITLVRRMKGSAEELTLPHSSMTVSSISLMNSEPGSGSPVYKEIASFRNTDETDVIHDNMFPQNSDKINALTEDL